MPYLLDEYKKIFLEKRGISWNFPKILSPYWSDLQPWFGVCQKPKWNLLMDWLSYDAIKSQIWPGNTKSFFSENEVIIETSQKCSFHIGVNYKHV